MRGSLFWVVWFSFPPFSSLSPLSHSFFLLLGNRKYRAKPETCALDSPRPIYICIVHWEQRGLNHYTSPRRSKKEILTTLTLLCMVLPFFFLPILKVDTHRCQTSVQFSIYSWKQVKQILKRWAQSFALLLQGKPPVSPHHHLKASWTVTEKVKWLWSPESWSV